MDEISILIVDDNVDLGNLLCEQIGMNQDMNVLGIAKDGLQALDMISKLKPDVVVLDIIMPNLDGIGVLEKISQLNIENKPVFIMLSAVGQDAFVHKAIALGAEYYVVKPFNIDLLVSRIRQLYKDRSFNASISTSTKLSASSEETVRQVNTLPDTQSLEVKVTNLLHYTGIPPHMAGYQYLREAIIQTVENVKAFNSLTKVLYPSVAQKFSTTPQKVERAIRNSIETAWSRGNPDAMDALFGYTINFNKGKPTNSEFIAMIADKIRINSSKK